MAATTESTYPWFCVVTGAELEQGDLLLECPVFVISPRTIDDPANNPITVERQTVIVMTQSCDLVVRGDGRSAAEDVIVCPVYMRSELAGHSVYGRPQGWEEARKGRHAAYHVLNRCEIPSHETEFMLVDFRRAYTLGAELVRDAASKAAPRLRLLPPYREHLSQGFARFFMRVGLPVDILPFK